MVQDSRWRTVVLWTAPGGDPWRTFTVATTTPNCVWWRSWRSMAKKLGVQGFAKTASVDAIVLRVNAEVDDAHALQLNMNVTRMSVVIAGLGEPPRRGDGQCGNMRSLLGQHKRVLLAESDVAGWGAFSKDPIKKDDYIGEYMGELISHTEADARVDSPFLFTLNDQYVIDAHRKGSKLTFETTHHQMAIALQRL